MNVLPKQVSTSGQASFENLNNFRKFEIPNIFVVLDGWWVGGILFSPSTRTTNKSHC